MILKNRHIGRFNLSLSLFDSENLPTVRKLLSTMVVVRAELSVVSDSIEYTAISEEYFDPIETGYEAPLYTFEINALDDIKATKC